MNPKEAIKPYLTALKALAQDAQWNLDEINADQKRQGKEECGNDNLDEALRIIGEGEEQI